jgi:lipoteichoic acid synthase
MQTRNTQEKTIRTSKAKPVRRAYAALAPYAHTIIMVGALCFTLAAKFYHSYRCAVVGEFSSWIVADLCVILGLEAVFAALCYYWPRSSVIRTITVIAACIWAWSVVNAAWIIKTGAQILPSEVMPLFKDPLDHLSIIGINLAKMPVSAFALLFPSAVGLTFFFFVLAKPQRPQYTRNAFIRRMAVILILVSITIPSRGSLAARPRPSQVATESFHYNSQLKAITSLLMPDSSPISREDFEKSTRLMPHDNQIYLTQEKDLPQYNVVMLILESIQYPYTSLANETDNLTPFLKSFADDSVVFTKTRSTLTHTSKAIFSLQTGRYPCASQDVVESIPVDQPYASLATILAQQQGYRTAFFQSAKGTFESRPSLVKNLGFQQFWAREHLNDPNRYLGYLSGDDYMMIDPIADWIQASEKPFFVTALCSAAHDPYEVPSWYGEPAKDLTERYKQIVRYTDSYLAALDKKLTALNLKDNTIVCIVGDHAEALGEHGKMGHERIGFDEVLRIVWAIRSPVGIQPGTRIHTPVSSIDVAPTLLALMGYDIEAGHFDGYNALKPIPEDRKVYFSGWVPEGPAGYMVGDRKFIHNPSVDEVSSYSLNADPMELNALPLPADQSQRISEDLINWRKGTLFNSKQQQQRGKRYVYDIWMCRWTGRDPVTRCTVEIN